MNNKSSKVNRCEKYIINIKNLIKHNTKYIIYLLYAFSPIFFYNLTTGYMINKSSITEVTLTFHIRKSDFRKLNKYQDLFLSEP
jgi:hypothetical protein